MSDCIPFEYPRYTYIGTGMSTNNLTTRFYERPETTISHELEKNTDTNIVLYVSTMSLAVIVTILLVTGVMYTARRNKKNVSPRKKYFHSCSFDGLPTDTEKVFSFLKPRLTCSSTVLETTYAHLENEKPIRNTSEGVVSKSLSFSSSDTMSCITFNNMHIDIPKDFHLGNMESVNSLLMEKDVFGRHWQFGATFTSFGGKLEKENSAITLQFHAGTFPDIGTFTVEGSIYTDARLVRQVLGIPDDVELASPIAEYVVSGNSLLKKHAVLRMPTYVNPFIDDVVVFCFQSRGSEKVVLQKIPMGPSVFNNEDMYYEFENNGYVNIYTKHFTGFIICKYCSSQQDTKPPLYAATFARYDQQNDLHYAQLRLYIVDAFCNIQDCFESLKHEENDVSRVLKDYKKLDFVDDVLDTSKLLINLQLTDEMTWRHKSRTGGKPIHNPKKIVDMKTVMRCCRRQDRPTSVEWDLESVPGIPDIPPPDCYVDMLLTNKTGPLEEEDWTKEDGRTTITYKERVLQNPQAVAIYTRRDITPEEQAAAIIESLTSTLSSDDVKSLARSAGLSDTDIEDCSHFRKSSEKEFRFQLLRRIKQVKGYRVFCQIVLPILKKQGRNDAIETLEKDLDTISLQSGHSSDAMNVESPLLMQRSQSSIFPDGIPLNDSAPV